LHLGIFKVSAVLFMGLTFGQLWLSGAFEKRFLEVLGVLWVFLVFWVVEFLAHGFMVGS
jgi:hypothetical protein